MDNSTREILKRKIADLSRQVAEKLKEINDGIVVSRRLLAELEDAQRALRAVTDGEKPADSEADLIRGIVNRALTSESSPGAGGSNHATAMVNDSTAPRSRAGVRPGTIKADVLQVLRAYPDGLIALDILRLLNERRGTPVERTSLSPQLTRLAKAGHIQRRGSLWFLPKEVHHPVNPAP